MPDLWFATGGFRPQWSGQHQIDWPARFADALQMAVTDTIEKAGGPVSGNRKETRGGRARTWFVNHYPLLGALAASFEIIETQEELERRSD